MSNTIRKRLAICSISLLLAACGGGAGNTGTSVAGVEGTGAKEGTVSGFGSIFVNGEKINTDSAVVIIDGQTSTEDKLVVGMKVRASIRGDQGNIASKVEFDRYLQGPVEDVDSDEGRITILSQTVLIADTSVLHNIGSRQNQQLDPANNDLVTVSGFVNENGEIVATFLSKADQPYDRQTSVFDLEGSVSNFNALSDQFQIGALLVDSSLANINESTGALANDAIVEVVGTQVNFQGVLLASDIRVITRKVGLPGNNVTLEGVVTAGNDTGQFDISDQKVDSSNATRQDNSAQNPAIGSRIQVSGNIDNQGVLQAQTITVIPPSTNELSGTITLLSDSRLQIFDTVITTTPSTLYQDSSSANNRELRYTSLANGDQISTTGYLDKDGQFIANTIQRFDNKGEASVTGELQVCNSFTQELKIANVTINADNNTLFRNGDNESSFVQFCANTPIGSKASANGQQNGDSLNASEVSSQDSPQSGLPIRIVITQQ